MTVWKALLISVFLSTIVVGCISGKSELSQEEVISAASAGDVTAQLHLLLLLLLLLLLPLIFTPL
jgi:hypothetical protein